MHDRTQVEASAWLHNSMPAVNGSITTDLPRSLRCSLHSLRYWTWHRGMQIPRAQAADHLLIVVDRGRLSADIDGTRHHADEGLSLWIQRHSMRQLRAEMNSCFIAVHLDLLAVSFLDLHCVRPLADCATEDRDILLQCLHWQHEQHKLAQQIAARHLRDYCLRQLVCDRLQISRPICEDRLLTDCLEALHREPAWNADDCARYCGLSRTRFRQRFTAITGTTPGRYITRLRAETAAHLLRTSDKPVSEISLSCGYENPNYLYRVFKTHYHCTPQEYRGSRTL